MTADEVRQYIEEKVPNFINVEMRGPGVAYHYTPHADKIAAAGKFLGAPFVRDKIDLQARPDWVLLIVAPDPHSGPLVLTDGNHRAMGYHSMHKSV